MSYRLRAVAIACAIALPLSGCGSTMGPGVTTGGPNDPMMGTNTIQQSAPMTSAYVIGGADSITAVPGSPLAKYRYRFKMVAPASDRFTFEDDDLSFYFRPTPGALHMQVQNRKNVPVTIRWDRCSFLGPQGSMGQVAHATTTFAQRYGTQSNTIVPPLGRYSDYTFPIEMLMDSPSGLQYHRPILPEDDSATNYQDRIFGIDLAVTLDQEQRTYIFRFQVASVLPR